VSPQSDGVDAPASPSTAPEGPLLPYTSVRPVQTPYFDSFTFLSRLGEIGLWSQKISQGAREAA